MTDFEGIDIDCLDDLPIKDLVKFKKKLKNGELGNQQTITPIPGPVYLKEWQFHKDSGTELSKNTLDARCRFPKTSLLPSLVWQEKLARI